MLSQLVLFSSESGNRSLRKEKECLRLSTIHLTKGLVSPCIRHWVGRWPFPKQSEPLMGRVTWKRRDAFFMSRRQEPNYRSISSFPCYLTRKAFPSAWSKADFSKKFQNRAMNCIMPTPHLVLGDKPELELPPKPGEVVGLVHDLTKNLRFHESPTLGNKAQSNLSGNRESSDKRLNLR